MRVDLHQHPKNFLDRIKDIVRLMKDSNIPEMEITGRFLDREISVIEDFMMENIIEE
jgi:hypothetical protein